MSLNSILTSEGQASSSKQRSMKHLLALQYLTSRSFSTTIRNQLKNKVLENQKIFQVPSSPSTIYSRLLCPEQRNEGEWGAQQGCLSISFDHFPIFKAELQLG
ncbi:cytochrome c oxidase subunit 7A1, mitochondrial isoform X2 [Heterodontus francisci]|uniref:cytochrome c oxidase subunit 7A1, mitochondrial isoform X2 n=1 Tax=Heterodontus francisci TaxID=7792 RepID=UPI00355BFEB0